MFRFAFLVLITRVALALDCDLLVIGGNESACAAAVQASRLGVERVVLVNDIEWLAGSFRARAWAWWMSGRP